MTGFSITLEARNPERGHYRAYRLEAAPDLFGVWLVEASFGRIGCTGRTMAYAASDEAEARRIVHSHLKRRATAPQRIGTTYEVSAVRDVQWLSKVVTLEPGAPI
jgi:hypothetical protein